MSYCIVGVFGSLDMHGLPREVYWTKLSAAASAGDNQITVTEPVSTSILATS